MRATIAFNRSISTAYLHLGITAPGLPKTFRAGKFVMVRPAWVEDPFLPRAFSIYRISGRLGDARFPGADGSPVVEILYKVLGKGTQCLARMEPDQEVEILGPLGNSFHPPDDHELPVLVAGGIGVPPIAALASQIRNSTFDIRNFQVFLGGKTHEDILCVKDFDEAGATIHITTEDGSQGTRGLVTDLLRPFLLSHRPAPSPSRHGSTQAQPRAPIGLYTCGPPGMLAAVAALAEEFSIPCQASLEANMACGFGACMGCAVEVRTERTSYKLVCMDGPVFDTREIVWK